MGGELGDAVWEVRETTTFACKQAARTDTSAQTAYPLGGLVSIDRRTAWFPGLQYIGGIHGAPTKNMYILTVVITVRISV